MGFTTAASPRRKFICWKRAVHKADDAPPRGRSLGSRIASEPSTKHTSQLSDTRAIYSKKLKSIVATISWLQLGVS